MKYCKSCKLEKDDTEFYKYFSGNLSSCCKLCEIVRVGKWQKEHPENVRVNQARWEKRYPNAMKEAGLRWLEKNPTYMKQYFEVHKEEHDLKCSEWYQENKRDFKKRFKAGISEAKRKSREWTITFDEYSHLVSCNCTYCKVELYSQTGVSLDRVDNTRGYTLDNVLPCCGSCNRIKNSILTVDEMTVVMTVLMNYRKDKQKEEIKEIN